MKRLFTALLLLTGVFCGAQSQALPPEAAATRFAESLKLVPSAYEPALTSVRLPLPLPPASLRLRPLASQRSADLQRAFEDTPAVFGYSCSDLERILLPGTEDDALSLRARLLALPGVFGLSDERWQLTFAGQGTFARLNYSSGVIALSTCEATRTPARATWFVGSTAPSVGLVLTRPMADTAGRLRWCTAAGTERPMRLFTGSALDLRLSLDGRLLAVAGWDAAPAVKVIDAQTGQVLQRLPLGRGVHITAFSGDGRTLLVQDAAGVYTRFDLASGQALFHWSSGSRPAARLQGGGADLFSEASGFTSPIKVIDARTGKTTLTVYSIGVADHLLTSSGEWLVTFSTRGVLEAFRTTGNAPGFSQKGAFSISLGSAASAQLLPSPHPDEVLALISSSAPDGGTAMQVLRWKVGDKTLTPEAQLTVKKGTLLALGADGLTFSSVPACSSP
ncbi:hypothetical protein [Deinococcus sp. QL22]|uniref:hypothetical protein n=1 Tax=Deinococcus sp. QL22 TaxID=2939437 RepID=UPI002017E928|nr:hypothetical protein [Deinococcus sp. QL22]UQN08714.1 hypothetical protein M1R55_21585 [Deinococcus sp. QL22]